MKTVLTGVKPTHSPHIGNYLGAIRPAIEMAKTANFRSLFFIADYHALTSVEDPKHLHNMIYDVAATWLACGLDPKRTIIYKQSDIPEVFELSWILACSCPKGFMNRAHAYKGIVNENQAAGKEDVDANINMGLYTYPILMAADILLFNTNVVPVGEDQVQHVEYARDIAQKFNRTYGNLLVIPEHVVQKNVKTVPGLDGRKMSKSYGNHIPLFMESDKMRKLVMKIVTDSQPPEAPKDPNNSTIFDIYKEFANPEQIEALRARYLKGLGWGEAKQTLFEALDAHLAPRREIYNNYMNDKSQLDRILRDGADRARAIAVPLMEKLRPAIGVR